jgi:hypothetical protein
MSTGIIVQDGVMAAVYESTEGTSAPPSSATDGYFQPNEDGVTGAIHHGVELKDRPVLTAGLIKAKPRPGVKWPDGQVGVEWRGGGTEGAEPDYAIMLESLFGTKTTISTTTTTKSSGNTQTVLAIEDADISKFAVNDLILVKQANEHRVHAITAVVTTGGSATLTLTPGRASGSFSNSVVISKAVTFKGADTGHKSYTLWHYLANTKRQSALGCRTKSMSIDNFVTGEIPSLSFGYEGLSHALVDGAAPHTPTYSDAEPPICLLADVLMDGTEVPMNEVAINFEQPISFIKSVGSDNGRITGRAFGKRNITGTIAPYMDDATFAYYTAFKAGTSFSLLLFAGNPSGTTGEFTMGSIVAIWLPQCIITDNPIDELDGTLRDSISFMAHGGTNGTTAEIAMAFI